MAKSLRRGEIWFVDLGSDKSSSMHGYRPCVIVSNDVMNIVGKNSLVVPLTSRDKKDYDSHVLIEKNNFNNLKCDSIALTENITSIKNENVRFCLGRLTDDQLEKLNHSLLFSFGLQ